MMKHVYISNNSATKENVAEIVFAKEKGIEQLREKSVDDSGNTIFIIDVHCSFKKAEKLQQQGGVIIYRHLLKMFEGKQDKLKVVFYSPISKDDLVKLKPENYVLKLLPFIECIYEEGQFERDLSNEITKYEKEGWVQFNNASENLLSGWALTNKEKIEKGQYPEKINTNGKKILFIDDQQGEWKSVYSIIFENTTVLLIKNGKGKEIQSQVAYRQKLKSGWNYFVSLTKTAIKQSPDLILSDFYLEENHDVSKWKDISEIQKISGYKLFNEIRILAPSIPYVFHTSSNKASIYKFLDANGVDDWIVKDVRTESSKEEKQESFEIFKYSLESFLRTANYKRMNKLWDSIVTIEDSSFKSSINSNIFESNKDAIIILLKSSWLALRRLLNREELFEKNLIGLEDFREDAFTTTAICNNLGKILEILECTNEKTIKKNRTEYKRPFKESFLIQMRHEASHSNSFGEFRIEDALIYFFILFEALQNKFIITSSFKFDFHKKSPKESYKFSLFWQYIQFYNETNKLENQIKQQIQIRLTQLFNKYKTNADFKELLLSDFISLLDKPCSTCTNINIKFEKNKCTLIFN